MMRKVLPLLLLVLASCGRNKDQVEIKGQFEGLQQAQFYLYSEDYNFGSLDTLFLEDGKFSYKRALQQPVVLTLLFPNFSEIQLIAEPGKTIEVKGNAAHLLETKITGSEENELLSDFRISSQKLSEKEKKMAVADFIHSHSATQAAVALYMQQFAKAEAPDAEVALELLGTLRKAQPENRMLLQLDAQQRAALENGVGRKLTPFEVEAMNGDTLSLASYNKPFLISTFAAWSMDFTSILKTIKKLRQNYGEELGFFNVALDVDDNKLYFQLERDTLLSVTVCEHKGFDSPIALRLGLSHMPGYILVDKDGVVVKRNINPSQLEAEVRKLLKK